MNRRAVIISFLLLGCNSFSQEKNKMFINLGLQGLETSFNINIYDDFYLEVFGGVGAGYRVREVDGFALNFDFVPFTKGAFKWYFANNEKAKHYVSVQSKYSFGDASDYSVNRALLSEVNWGVEKSIGKRLLLSGHVGYGHVKDFDNNFSDNLLTLGLTLKYNVLRF